MPRIPLKKQVKPLITEKLSIEALLDFIDEDVQDQLVEAFNVDKWVTKFKGKLFFKLLLFTLFKDRFLSLRGIADNYESFQFKSFDQYALGKTAHSSIQERLKTLDYRFVEGIYENVYQQLTQHYSAKDLDLKYNIIRFDSTLVHSFTHLIEGMKVGNSLKNKVQLKFATEFGGQGLLKMSFFNDQKHLSEETTLSELILRQSFQDKDLVVFDMGLKGRKHFAEITNQGIPFITRALPQVRYELIESYELSCSHSLDGRLRFVSDQRVYLYGTGHKKEESCSFRLICAIDVYTGKQVNFITNIFDISCSEVAEYYRKRWEIEVLFRFMKQEMHLGHLLSHKLNAILIMLYVSLIAAMLVLLYKSSNGIESYRQAKRKFYIAFELYLIEKMIENEENLKILKANIKELKE